MNYRNLTDSEISQLERNGCSSEDWGQIKVKETFDSQRLYHVSFAGEVNLGVCSGKIEVEEGVEKPSGIYHCYIKDSTIEDHVYISHVRNLMNYHISEDVVIENVSTLLVNKESTFGNGLELEILNEGGGRNLPMFDRMSAQIAYLIVNYRHDKLLIDKLTGIIQDYAQTKRSNKGMVETGARILNTTALKNVHIGRYSEVQGANILEEGTIASCREDPVKIGDAVIAKEFIVLSGSRIDSGAILEKSFVGQSVKIGKQFSAENTAIFANSEGFHGEAVSVYGGPYTISHHKSTLLIAGQYSFYNAGSGSNKSNHLYKLGPVHQGTLERGSKTGSFSYMMWPTHIGPFSVVLGKHKSSFDISELPFSYIDVKGNKTEVIPALNLFTVGTIRDSEKWPKRDKRKAPDKLDLIHFDFFSPFIVQKMVKATKMLKKLKDNASKEQDYVTFNGAHIPRLILRTAQKYYEIGIKVYLGKALAKQLKKSKAIGFEALMKEITPTVEHGKGKWLDVSGMFSPQGQINSICENVKAGKISSVDELRGEFENIYNSYGENSWAWCTELIAERLGIQFSDLTKEQMINILKVYKEQVAKMNKMIMQDAQKEFSSNMKIGFGRDGDETVKDQDFEAVRGTYESNSFVKKLEEEVEEVGKKADAWIKKLEAM